MYKKKIILLFSFFLLLPFDITFAASTTLNVSATILSKSNCKFNDKAATLAFGNLDPISGPDVVTKSATLEFVCNGSANIATYAITDDDGLNESGPNANRMLHDTVAGTYLPYNFSLSPVSGTIDKSKGVNTTATLTVTGTILGNDYRTALIDSYSDTVTITINP